jgi:hypothetical protein
MPDKKRWLSFRGWSRDAKKLRVAEAWRNFQRGNGTIEDFQAVLADLVAESGYYTRPSYAQWRRIEGHPDGFELHCALLNERAKLVEYIIGYLGLTDDELIALEQATRS